MTVSPHLLGYCASGKVLFQQCHPALAVLHGWPKLPALPVHLPAEGVLSVSRTVRPLSRAPSHFLVHGARVLCGQSGLSRCMMGLGTAFVH